MPVESGGAGGERTSQAIHYWGQSTWVAGRPETQWAAILIPFFVGLDQPAIDMILAEDVANYGKARETILQMLKLSLEAYQWHLQDITLGPDYHPQMIRQKKSQASCLRWVRLAVRTTAQVAEAVMVKYYISLLPFKAKN